MTTMVCPKCKTVLAYQRDIKKKGKMVYGRLSLFCRTCKYEKVEEYKPIERRKK